MTQPANPQRVLVIGGTQFVGRHLVERLLEFDGAEVAMLNRGHTVLPETLREAVASGKLAHLKCDRMNQRERFARLVAERKAKKAAEKQEA